MKTRIKSFATRFTITLLTTIFLTISSTCSFAQNGDPPPPPGEHGENGSQIPGGGAPIDSGMVLLIALAAGYGGKKVFQVRKKGLK